MDVQELSKEMALVWLTGVTLSTICLIVQIVLYIFVPSCRKLDLKILTQITIARLMNVTLEYTALKITQSGWIMFVIMALYMHSDCALICWMFLFTKNLYDKVILVFITKKISFGLTSILVWVLTFPMGILCPALLYMSKRTHNPQYFIIFFKVYAISKFVILSVNLLFFCRIFYVAIKRKISGNVKGVWRTCIISFILVSISGVQVFLTDLVSFFNNDFVLLIFSVINSYQVLAVMVIFVNLVRGFSPEESLSKTITKTWSRA